MAVLSVKIEIRANVNGELLYYGEELAPLELGKLLESTPFGTPGLRLGGPLTTPPQYYRYTLRYSPQQFQ
jgi:hypothetical protein